MARLAQAGTHDFSESLFLGGFDISEVDATWTWQAFQNL